MNLKEMLPHFDWLSLLILSGTIYSFLTNNFKLSAVTIAAIYKDRWQVELFFKAIKQNLIIKAFSGVSRNAVLTQIWIAIITFLLVSFARDSAKKAGPFRVFCVFCKRIYLNVKR